MKRTKIGLIAVLSVMVLYIGVTWFVGMRTQSTLMQMVENVNREMVQNAGGSVEYAARVEVIDYQRGVFSSTVRYALHLPSVMRYALDLSKDIEMQLQFQDTIQHGPLPWAYLLEGDFSPLLARSQMHLLPTALTQRWFDLVEGQPIQVDTRIAFSRAVASTITAAPIASEATQGVLQFSGGHMTVQFMNGFDDIDATGAVALLAYTDDQGTIQMRDITASSQMRKRDDVVQTESQVAMASVVVENSDVENVSLENFQVTMTAERAGDLLDTSVRYGVDKVQSMALNFGAFELGVHAKRLDFVAANKLLQGLVHVVQGLDENGNGDFQEAFTEIEPYLLTILQAEPSLSIDPLLWATDKGESRIVLRTDLFADKEDTQATFDEDFGLHALREVHLAVEVSRAMAVQVAMLLQGEDGDDENVVVRGMFSMLFDQYVNQLQRIGLVRMDGDKAILNASYRGEDKSVDLNGKRIPLAEFITLVMRSM